MRVLLTGATPLQTTRPSARTRVRARKIDVPAAVADALTSLGHDVEWRAVAPTERECPADVVWLCAAPLLSFGASRALGALRALSWGAPTVVFYDDWKTRQVGSHARAIALDPRGTVNKTVGPGFLYRDRARLTDSDVDDLVPAVERGAARLVDLSWGARAVPAFAHDAADALPSEVGAAMKIDPSYLAVDVFGDISRDSALAEPYWALASLSNQSQWVHSLGLEREVRSCGHRTTVGQLADERDVAALYAEALGILSPPYHHTGSGWWRSRFVYGALSHTPVVGEPSEMGYLSPAYAFKPRELEALSTSERRDVAEAQAAALLPTLSTRAQFEAQVAATLARVIVNT